MSFGEFLSSPGGLSLLALVAGGVGATFREVWKFVTSADKREHDEKDALRKDIAYLRQRVEELQQQVNSLDVALRNRNTDYFSLYNDHIEIRFQHKAVLSAIDNEADDAARDTVNRVLAAYGTDIAGMLTELDAPITLGQ